MMYVYIITNKPYGTLYIGVTNDLIRRVYEHKTKATLGFSARYNLDKLVYYAQFDDPETAILYEKKLKDWNRAWKLHLIEQTNPGWVDLYPSLLG